MSSKAAERVRSVTWLAVLAALYGTCLAMTWNALATKLGRGALLSVGEALVGEEKPVFPRFDRQRFASHAYQIELQRFAMLSVPERPVLVRVHNEILWSIFDTSPRPNIVIGRDDHMIELSMVSGYCRRRLADYKPRMHRRAAQLKALQDHFQARGCAFLFVITPSKMARMRDKFLDRVDCPALPQERDAIVPLYAGVLAQAGIHVVDTASLMDALRKNGSMPFPVGGLHWNMLGAAHGTNAVIRLLNQSARRPLLPELRWTTEPTPGPLFEDDDLAVGLNLMEERSYPSISVSFAPSGPCPAGKLSATVIGTSFTVQLVRALGETQCIARGRRFVRLTQSYWEFPPEREVATGPVPLDFVAPRLDADIVILEEHENMATQSPHVTALYNLVLGDNRSHAASGTL